MHNSNSYNSARADVTLACDTYRNLDSGATGAVVKAGPGVVYGYYISNNGASVRYVRLYSKLTAPLTTDTPLVTLAIPAASAANTYLGPGIAFAAGIGVRTTTLVGDADNTAPTANDVVVNLFYK